MDRFTQMQQIQTRLGQVRWTVGQLQQTDRPLYQAHQMVEQALLDLAEAIELACQPAWEVSTHGLLREDPMLP